MDTFNNCISSEVSIKVSVAIWSARLATRGLTAPFSGAGILSFELASVAYRATCRPFKDWTNITDDTFLEQ